MTDLNAFRGELRDWLAQNCPQSMRTVMPADEMPSGGLRTQYKNSDTKLWMDRCAAQGFTAPSWPKAYGGAGFDQAQMAIWQDELRRINARPPLWGWA